MSTRRLLPAKREKHEVDVSLAIVNIVLLLIFFFLATGSMTSAPKHALMLSETAELPIEQLPQPILIIEGPEQFSMDGAPVAAELLGQAVEGMDLLHVLIDRGAEASILLELLDRPELASLEIRLVTIHRSGES